ncbi:unnamed protein product [Linum tenue]|uniref:Uncharacterized protein n=1 Tax=Linum tenue TaxID=586396 RepID=A0AAV0P8N9_9ROSI|nr:unnamed protein product [Linum tenue]
MAWNKKEVLYPVQIIPFSAFWLRSSVVSVLISLISDTWGRKPTTGACFRGLSRVSPMRCTIARAWRTPPILVQSFFSLFMAHWALAE